METLVNFTMSTKGGIDVERQLLFGWASVSIAADGNLVEDAHGHTIDPLELEDAVYLFVRCGGMMGGVEHQYMYAGTIVESMVFTKEKMAKMGIPEGTLPQGWWIGMYVYDKEIFEFVKSGVLPMLSIAGTAYEEDEAGEMEPTSDS
jgi:hypothetical protein